MGVEDRHPMGCRAYAVRKSLITANPPLGPPQPSICFSRFHCISFCTQHLFTTMTVGHSLPCLHGVVLPTDDRCFWNVALTSYHRWVIRLDILASNSSNAASYSADALPGLDVMERPAGFTRNSNHDRGPCCSVEVSVLTLL